MWIFFLKTEQQGGGGGGEEQHNLKTAYDNDIAEIVSENRQSRLDPADGKKPSLLNL